jgi:hypothetical protein
LANHDYNYLEVCKNYREVLDTEAVENNPEHLRAVREPTSTFFLTCTNLNIVTRPHCLLRCPVPLR